MQWNTPIFDSIQIQFIQIQFGNREFYIEDALEVGQISPREIPQSSRSYNHSEPLDQRNQVNNLGLNHMDVPDLDLRKIKHNFDLVQSNPSKT